RYQTGPRFRRVDGKARRDGRSWPDAFVAGSLGCPLSTPCWRRVEPRINRPGGGSIVEVNHPPKHAVLRRVIPRGRRVEVMPGRALTWPSKKSWTLIAS